jgi:serine/threonine-protein phosphatase 2A activator
VALHHGNQDFRIAESVSPSKLQAVCGNPSDGVDANAELKEYLLGSFGSPQRLDYGTGHELSFVAFIAYMEAWWF